MSERIVVDPVTRIEGHLRIEAEVKDGKIVDAWSAGTMVRGLEIILKGRDPRDAWAFCERVCGVCTTIHALASCRAVEDALGIKVPPAAELIRNIMYLRCRTSTTTSCTSTICTPLTGSTSLSALKADPAEASAHRPEHLPLAKELTRLLCGPPNTPARLRAKRPTRHLRQRLLGPPRLQAPARRQLCIGVAHYLEALEWQKEIVKVHAVFGGKNPHPNYLGGRHALFH